MAVTLICELPVSMPSHDYDVIDDLTNRPKLLAVSVVTSRCERPRNILLPVDLRRRRRRRRKLHNDTFDSHSASPSDPLIKYLVDFAVCVPPLFGNVTATELVEFIEVNHKAGISTRLTKLQFRAPDFRDIKGPIRTSWTSSCRGHVDELATEPFMLLHCEHGTGYRRS